MFGKLKASRQANDPTVAPLHWANRGWLDSQFSVIPGIVRKGPGTRPVQQFDMPLALLWTAASGLDTPVERDTGATILHPRIPWKVGCWSVWFCWRDGWIVCANTSAQNDLTQPDYMPYYRPVRELPDKRTAHIDVLRAPFPITVDTGLTLFSTCSLGHTDDPPFMPPYNGSPSRAMVDLMNSFRMKPGYIVWNGYLHVWVNSMYWKQIGSVDDKVYGGIPASEELELFKAYKAYYVQLQREIPSPYRGPIAWPDQCDPRFPLPGDPRAVNYIPNPSNTR
ncbi:hypothetical protein [Bifidobacterium leontopitheci]|uniref:Uncharacterized protein n=1 Tax=Bifidobacterium leontopitheci TaxID=2650774 RepID=A0A6I1GBG8_9BIFI|nr:hypothetical protein [Bifidobacterium leontopitheci]KAB7788993.1 hypothetical protein F7D09_2050 [Bifidobacterium leontopitheci]